MVTVKLSCDGVTKIWEKYSGKNDATSTGKVEYGGTSYDCATMSLNGSTALACNGGEEAFTERGEA